MGDQLPPGNETRFEPELLHDNSLSARFQRWLFVDNFRALSTLPRIFWPNVRLGGMVIATRREDVEQILADTEAFHVRFGARVAALHPNAVSPFGLGTDGPEYAGALRLVSDAMRLEDIPRVAGILRAYVARHAAAATLDAGALTRLAQADFASRYMGLGIDDIQLNEFALWCLAMGNYAFGRQTPGSADWRAGRGAGTALAAALRSSIAKARAGGSPDTPIGRMVVVEPSDAPVEAALTGLLVALIPGATMAITHVIQVLLSRPTAMKAARAAAQAADDQLLGRCLLEALRFKPIFPGPFRDCAIERTIAAGTRRALPVRPGELVLAATQSAMFDGRRVQAPGVFNPDRSASDTMVFGFGRHWCFGYAVGQMQLLETLRPLLLRGFHQSRADRAANSYFGAFPEHLPVQLA
jgi:cytochrome P450